MSKREKKCKPLTQNVNCFNCNNCTYVGDGDHICDMTLDLVIVEWEPTEDFYICNGKDFEEI